MQHGQDTPPDSVPWSFRLPKDLLDKFKEAARAENRTAAGALRNLMEERVAEHETTRSDSPVTSEVGAG